MKTDLIDNKLVVTIRVKRLLFHRVRRELFKCATVRLEPESKQLWHDVVTVESLHPLMNDQVREAVDSLPHHWFVEDRK